MSAKQFFTHLFYRQHPDTALRYLPMVDLIKQKNWSNLKIIEIGSGSYGITPYLKKEVTGVDTTFDEPEFFLLKQVKTSGENLPFRDISFDIAILSDVLEHIPKHKRKKVLDEVMRVVKSAVIIGGPFGSDAFKQDLELAEYSQKKLGSMHKFFKDHLKFGLPEVSDVNRYLKDNKRVKSIEIVGEFLNLRVRNWMMKIFITNSKLQFYFYLKGLMFFVPILKLLNSKPCYRTIILVKL